MYVNNSSDHSDYHNSSSDLEIPLLALVGVLSVTFSLLNLFPITTILRSHRLRYYTSNDCCTFIPVQTHSSSSKIMGLRRISDAVLFVQSYYEN